MQYCRCKLNLSVNSCLLFSAPRWNEATLLITKRTCLRQTKDWQTAQPPLLWIHLIPTPLNYFSFFYSRIYVVLSFSFIFCFCKSSILRWTYIFIVFLNSLFNFSIHFVCGYNLISRNFKMVGSINFKLVAFICFLAYADIAFISS